MPAEPYVRKVLFEARYKATLAFFDLRNKLGQSLSKEFPHWRYDAIRTVMFDNKDRSHFVMESKRIGFDFDRAGRFNDARGLISKVGKKTIEMLEIETFERIGLRFFFVYPSPMKYKELNDVFVRKMISQEKAFFDVFSDNVNDSGIALEFQKDDLHFRAQTGPTRPDESIGRIPFETKIFSQKDVEELRNSLSETNFFVDLDCWKTEIGVSEFTSFLDRAFEVSTKVLDNLSNFLIG
jgi:hypothetical protein